MSGTWSTDNLRRWYDGLRFISLPWVGNFYRHLGLPCERQTQQAIQEWAGAAFRGQVRPGSTDAGESNKGRVREGLVDLAKVTTMPVANQTEAWLERHFVSTRLGTVLYVWRAVLQRASSPPGGAYPLIEPPLAMQPAVAASIGGRSSPSFSRIVATEAPAISPAERDLGLGLSFDALNALEITDNEETWRSLEELAVSLGPNGRQTALEWARRQAAALDLPPERLGQEYPSADSVGDPKPIRLI